MRPIKLALLGAALALPGMARAMVVPIDHSARLNVPGAAASILVGNPSIADVTVVDSHTLFIQGRGYGSTNIVVLDRSGRTIYAGDVTVEGSGSNVSIYRGVTPRSDFACSPRCIASAAPGGSDSKSDGTLNAFVSGLKTAYGQATPMAQGAVNAAATASNAGTTAVAATP